MNADAHTNRCKRCNCYDPLGQHPIDFNVRKPGNYWVHLVFPNHYETDRIAECVYGIGWSGIDQTTVAYVDERRLERPAPP
jgi:hypothetical protein